VIVEIEERPPSCGGSLEGAVLLYVSYQSSAARTCDRRGIVAWMVVPTCAHRQRSPAVFTGMFREARAPRRVVPPEEVLNLLREGGGREMTMGGARQRRFRSRSASLLLQRSPVASMTRSNSCGPASSRAGPLTAGTHGAKAGTIAQSFDPAALSPAGDGWAFSIASA